MRVRLRRSIRARARLRFSNNKANSPRTHLKDPPRIIPMHPTHLRRILRPLIPLNPTPPHRTPNLRRLLPHTPLNRTPLHSPTPARPRPILLARTFSLPLRRTNSRLDSRSPSQHSHGTVRILAPSTRPTVEKPTPQNLRLRTLPTVVNCTRTLEENIRQTRGRRILLDSVVPIRRVLGLRILRRMSNVVRL